MTGPGQLNIPRSRPGAGHPPLAPDTDAPISRIDILLCRNTSGVLASDSRPI
jgi:hypothetical protein